MEQSSEVQVLVKASGKNNSTKFSPLKLSRSISCFSVSNNLK